MKTLFFCFLFFIFSKLSGYQIDSANIQKGDFIVYAFKQQLSLLIVKEKTEHTLTIEELSLPKNENIQWQEWITKNAPGHTSWTITKIDLTAKKVFSVFDVDLQREIPQKNETQFLPTLLKLSLHPLKPEERKYIGSQPLAGEVDTRKLWLPKVYFHGKEVHPPIQVFRAFWPADGSELSEKPFDLYFATKDALVYLPYWIELHGPVSKIKIMAVDSGTNLSTQNRR